MNTISETALADQLYDALNAVGNILLKRGHSLPASVREAAYDACNAWLVARGGEPVQELPAEERRAMAIAARELRAPGVSDPMVGVLRAIRAEGFGPDDDVNDVLDRIYAHCDRALEAVGRARSAGPKLAYYQTHEPPHCPTCDCAGPDEQGQK
jgi:hypothetical protein